MSEVAGKTSAVNRADLIFTLISVYIGYKWCVKIIGGPGAACFTCHRIR